MLTFEILKNLYCEKKKSSPQIARSYNCDPKYIRQLLRKYNIKVRTKSQARKLLFNVDIPKDKLKTLYLKDQLSSVQISKIFRCSPGLIRNKLKEYDIPIRTIQEALPLSNKSPYLQKDFSGSLEEKAYLIGLTKGDLHVVKKSERSSTIRIAVGSTKPAMISLVEKSFAPYGHIWKGRPTANNEVVHLRCSLNNTFRFLVNLGDAIAPWILKDTKHFAAFLAGYADAEGTFCLCGGSGVFSIRSQDKTILHQTREKLVELGILLRPPQIARKQGTRDIRGTISNKDIWAIWVHRKDALPRLFDLIQPYIKHETKLQSIEIIKRNIAERNEKYHRLGESKHDKLYLQEGIKL